MRSSGLGSTRVGWSCRDGRLDGVVHEVDAGEQVDGSRFGDVLLGRVDVDDGYDRVRADQHDGTAGVAVLAEVGQRLVVVGEAQRGGGPLNGHHGAHVVVGAD